MNIGRKLSFLALAGLLPISALAQDAAKATVTVYGTLNLNMQSTEAKGSTSSPATNDVSSRLALSNDSSNIGVRAALKLNDMIGGVAQCESSANVSGIAGATFCGRNSRVGLTGDWGTLFYGNWDTPYKAAAYGTKADDPFGNTDVYDNAGLMTSPGFSTKTGAYSTASDSKVLNFTVRAQNSIAYHSPKFMGLSAKLQYVADMYKNNNGTQDPSLFSAVVNFDWQALSVFATYEQHNDGFGLVGINGSSRQLGATVANTAGTPTTGLVTTALHTTDTGLRFGAGYELNTPVGATTLSAVWEQLNYEQSNAAAGALKKFSRNAIQFGLKHRMGDHELRLRYNGNDKGTATVVGGSGNTDHYGATMLTVGYAYYIAPSLQVYGYYAKITNQLKAQYTFGTGGDMPSSLPAGADPSAFGLGTRFSF
jgi:predicted porin